MHFVLSRLFALVEKSSVNVYSYDGRHLFAPKWPNMQCDTLNANLITLSNDTIAIRDQIDEKSKCLLFLNKNESFKFGNSYSFYTEGIASLRLGLLYNMLVSSSFSFQLDFFFCIVAFFDL